DRTAVLKLSDIPEYDDRKVDITLRGYDGQNILVEEFYRARGSSRAQAVENARMVNYTITQQDSILLFDPKVRFADDAVFRNQEVDIMLNIPYDYPFVM